KSADTKCAAKVFSFFKELCVTVLETGSNDLKEALRISGICDTTQPITKSGKKKEHNRVFESVKAYFFGRAHGSHGMVMNVHSDSRPFAFPPMPPLPPMEMPPF